MWRWLVVGCASITYLSVVTSAVSVTTSASVPLRDESSVGGLSGEAVATCVARGGGAIHYFPRSPHARIDSNAHAQLVDQTHGQASGRYDPRVGCSKPRSLLSVCCSFTCCVVPIRCCKSDWRVGRQLVRRDPQLVRLSPSSATAHAVIGRSFAGTRTGLLYAPFVFVMMSSFCRSAFGGRRVAAPRPLTALPPPILPN